jgi:hypothetical protein
MKPVAQPINQEKLQNLNLLLYILQVLVNKNGLEQNTRKPR